MSQVMAMAQRLQEAEETIASLRAQGSASSCEDTRSRLSPSPQITTVPTKEPTNVGFSVPARPGTTPPPSIVSAKEPSASQSTDQPTNVPIACSGTSKEALPSDLSVDENGEIQYYGPTSAVHDPPQLQLESPITRVSPAASGSSSSEIRSMLMAHAQESKIWEEFALGNASLQTGIPRQIMAKLLHMHWTWVSPMFMYVYRHGKLASILSSDTSKSVFARHKYD
jgi:hypothetical protein